MSEDELRDWYDASVLYVLAANGAKDDDADGAAALTAAKGVARLVTMARVDEFAEYMRAHPDPGAEGIARSIEERFSLTATPVPGGLESASSAEEVAAAVVRWVRDVAVFAGIAPDDAAFRLSEWVADGAGDDEPVNPIRLVEAYPGHVVHPGIIPRGGGGARRLRVRPPARHHGESPHGLRHRVRAEGHRRVRQGVPRPLGHRVMDVMRAQRRFAGDAVIPLGA